MKLTIFASLFAAVAAFSPVQESARTSVATKAFENEIGVTEPVGFYDPLNLLQGADQAKFDRLRFVELKHGRISMLAVVGYIATATGTRLGGNIDLSGTTFAEMPSGFANLAAFPKGGLCQILFLIGLLETSFMKDWTGGESVGDFRNNWIDFGWDTFSATEKTRQSNLEINHGRAAMMGILGIMIHEQLGNLDSIFLLPIKD